MAELTWDDHYGDRHTAMTVLVYSAHPAEILDALQGALLTGDDSPPQDWIHYATRSATGTKTPVKHQPKMAKTQLSTTPGRRPLMKPGIHPDYHPVVFQDATTGAMFLTRSTIASSRTIEWESPTACIPTHWSSSKSPRTHTRSGRAARRIVDTAGQVEKFRRRYGSRQRPAPGQDAAAAQ